MAVDPSESAKGAKSDAVVKKEASKDAKDSKKKDEKKAEELVRL